MQPASVFSYVLGVCAIVLLVVGTIATPIQKAFAQSGGTIVCDSPTQCPLNGGGYCDNNCLNRHCDSMNPSKVCQNDYTFNCVCR
jgi:hypothetical protein